MSDTSAEQELAELYRRNPVLAELNGNTGLVDGTSPEHHSEMVKRHKYNAVATTVDGVVFPSKAEARRYEQLKLLERNGRISNLELQPRYPLLVNGEKVGEYRGDFRYIEDGVTILEDTKGMKTDVYKIKAKLVKAIYGITIRETK